MVPPTEGISLYGQCFQEFFQLCARSIRQIQKLHAHSPPRDDLPHDAVEAEWILKQQADRKLCSHPKRVAGRDKHPTEADLADGNSQDLRTSLDFYIHAKNIRGVFTTLCYAHGWNIP